MEKDKKKHIPVRELEVYKLAHELSDIGWDIYENLGWQDKKVMGDQFIEATDSFGANIVEGYSRYHFLDKIKFFYTARASLAEALDHWLELLKKRNKITEQSYKRYRETAATASLKLQNFISAVYKAKSTREDSD